MYRNLKAEMKRGKIRVKDIAELWGITEHGASMKINHGRRISVEEAILVRDTYFPDMDLKTLFENC